MVCSCSRPFRTTARRGRTDDHTRGPQRPPTALARPERTPPVTTGSTITPAGPPPRTTKELRTRTLRRHKGRIGVGVFLLSLHQVCEVLVSVAIGLTIDLAVATGDFTALLWCRSEERRVGR